MVPPNTSGRNACCRRRPSRRGGGSAVPRHRSLAHMTFFPLRCPLAFDGELITPLKKKNLGDHNVRGRATTLTVLGQGWM